MPAAERCSIARTWTSSRLSSRYDKDPMTTSSPAETGILLESETRALLAKLDIVLPQQFTFERSDADAAAAEICDTFHGDGMVLKVSSRTVLHKSDIGGVSVVARTPKAIREAVDRMAVVTG